MAKPTKEERKRAAEKQPWTAVNTAAVAIAGAFVLAIIAGFWWYAIMDSNDLNGQSQALTNAISGSDRPADVEPFTGPIVLVVLAGVITLFAGGFLVVRAAVKDDG